MFVKTIFLATIFTTAIAAPLPLHNTNMQRLPDQPATSSQPDLPIITMLQKHKYVPEFTAPMLRLCGRTFNRSN
ncbi:hypothetical protein SVAN01_05963 [Stagonosporopsis vannaccii]|nr:hypothetical protein SVAN01_05963 [Stagonosporopsis vannaccii]